MKPYKRRFVEDDLIAREKHAVKLVGQGYRAGKKDIIFKLRCFLACYERTNIIFIETIREYLEELEK